MTDVCAILGSDIDDVLSFSDQIVSMFPLSECGVIGLFAVFHKLIFTDRSDFEVEWLLNQDGYPKNGCNGCFHTQFLGKSGEFE